MADLMSEAMRNALSIQVTGVGCEPDCDHAHAAEPTTTLLTYMVSKANRWLASGDGARWDTEAHWGE